VVAALESRAHVLPVPWDAHAGDGVVPHWPGRQRAAAGAPLRLLWLGRLEHDKGGEGLLAVLRELERAAVDYELAIAGQVFRELPAAFAQIRDEFDHRLVQFGWLTSAGDYAALLAAGDIVLSTAWHEYQGLALMEAVARGCLPAVPDRLVYPEIYPAQFRYPSLADAAQEALAAAQLVLRLAVDLRSGRARAPDVSACTCDALAPAYAGTLAALRRAG